MLTVEAGDVPHGRALNLHAALVGELLRPERADGGDARKPFELGLLVRRNATLMPL
jgi:hypothetical protein